MLWLCSGCMHFSDLLDARHATASGSRPPGEWQGCHAGPGHSWTGNTQGLQLLHGGVAPLQDHSSRQVRKINSERRPQSQDLA